MAPPSNDDMYNIQHLTFVVRATNLDAAIQMKNANKNWSKDNVNSKAICSTLGRIVVVTMVKNKGFCNKGDGWKMLAPPDVWVDGVYRRLCKSNAANFDQEATKFLLAKDDYEEGDSYETLESFVAAIQALPGYSEGIIPANKKSHLEKRIQAIEAKLGLGGQFDDEEEA